MICHCHCSCYHCKHLSNWWHCWWRLPEALFRNSGPRVTSVETNFATSSHCRHWGLSQLNLWNGCYGSERWDTSTLRMLPAVILSSSKFIRLVPQPGHRHPLRLHLHSLQQQLQLCYSSSWVLLHQDIVHPVTIALVHLFSRTLHFLKVFLLVGAKERITYLQFLDISKFTSLENSL